MTDASTPSPASPPSAWQLAQQLGDALPDPASLDPEALQLTAAIRRLVAAATASDIAAADRADITESIDALTQRLEADRREPVIALGRFPNGRITNFTQAGSGELNPQALPLRFDPIGAAATDEPTSIEVVARCTLTDAHGGPPERVHGGVVATLLDEVIGIATMVGNAPGLTAGLNIRYRAGTPLHQPLTVHARYTRTEGRKHFATGEVRSGDIVTAEAEGIYISPPISPDATD